MATYDQMASRGAGTSSIASLANWMGAVLSLALVAGVGVWGYRLAMRDVTGIPVVRAAEGPMRVAPKDAGGEVADHQGLSVNAVAGFGAAEPPADRLVLAPQPVALTDEDKPLTALVTPALTAPVTSDTPATAEAGETPQEEVDPLIALANRIAANVKPLDDLQPAPDDDVALLVTPPADPETPQSLTDAAPFSGPGLARSLRPVQRPAGLSALRAAPAATDTAAPVVDLDPAQIAVGTSLVQLGAFDTVEIAQTEWTRFAGRFDAFFDDKQRVVQQASSGGRVFYRLRVAGFDDLSDARRFCAALVAKDAECIPVVVR